MIRDFLYTTVMNPHYGWTNTETLEIITIPSSGILGKKAVVTVDEQLCSIVGQ